MRSPGVREASAIACAVTVTVDVRTRLEFSLPCALLLRSRVLTLQICNPPERPQVSPQLNTLSLQEAGGGRYGAGGGAGGFTTASGYAVTPNTSYTVTVGDGGAG